METRHRASRARPACSASASLGSSYAFDIEVRVGAGAYVCGEETSLLESLEGKRGQVRAKPPLPAHKGLFGKPTVINNVLSLAAVPFILAEGAALLSRFRHGPLARHHADPARRQRQAWRPVRDRLRHHARRDSSTTSAAARASGRPVRAVQVGGPLGAYFPRALFDTPFDYEAFAAARRADRPWRHRGVRRHASTWRKQARFALEFCAIECCGKCTPCRIGSTRGVETMDKIIAGERRRGEARRWSTDLCNTMKFGSLCALGGFTPYPVMSALTHFPEDFGASTEAPRELLNEEHAPCRLIQEIDYGTPGLEGREEVTLTIDGVKRDGARRHLDHARGDGDRHRDPQALRHRHARARSAPAGSAWSRSRAAAARPPPAPRRSPKAWSCTPRPSG